MSASPRDKTTWAAPAPATDPSEIRRFVTAVPDDGLPYELRILRKDTSPNGNKLIDSGFFTTTEPQALIEAAARITGDYASGVYLTMSPVDPSLPAELGRPLNRLARAVGKTTTDPRITRRRIILIDVDAVKPAGMSGMSATDAERSAALATRDEIEIWLQGEGWPTPRVKTSSGNGGGILYEVDLPNDEMSRQLIKRDLEALSARFTTATATVDVANSNAARITRIPGTVTAKGENTPDRPWRRATAVYPDGAGLVTRAQLEALATQAPSATRRTSQRTGAATDANGTPIIEDSGNDEYARLLEEGAPEGQRRTALLKLVGHYIARGLSTREIGVILRTWADRCQPPVPHAHVEDIIRDVATAEARKQTQGAEDTPPEGVSSAMSVSELRALVATQRAELADWKAQAKAWEHLFTNRAIPDKAKRVLIHLHKRLGVTVGRPVPDTKPRDLFPDAQDLQAEGLAMTAFKEGLDVLLSLDLVTQQKVMKKVPATEPGDEIGACRARARGRDWYYKYGLNGPAVNALWNQLPTLTDIAPTERQIKVKQSREECLQKAIEEEKPTLHVVRALKREVAEVRQDRQNVVFEYHTVTQERDNAREQAEAAARERDQALQNAQRIIRDHQQPTVMLGCKGCGTRIDLDTWRCDDCRAREREAAFDSKSDVDFESTSPHTVALLTGQHPTLNPPLPPDTFKKPCYGGCGTLTDHGYTCKACREAPVTPLHIQTGSALGQREVRHDR